MAYPLRYTMTTMYHVSVCPVVSLVSSIARHVWADFNFSGSRCRWLVMSFTAYSGISHYLYSGIKFRASSKSDYTGFESGA